MPVGAGIHFLFWGPKTKCATQHTSCAQKWFWGHFRHTSFASEGGLIVMITMKKGALISSCEGILISVRTKIRAP